MFRAEKIAFILFTTAWLLSTGSFVLFAQSKANKLHSKRPVTIGFQTGKSALLDNTNSSLTHRTAKWMNNNKFTLRVPIDKHFKAETGINFSPLQSQYANGTIKYYLPKTQPSSIPLTLQYYPMQHHCKIQPYCGIGMQYNFGSFNPSLHLPEVEENNSANDPSGTKYISILFTQGVTYEINTKIQLTQSFHFIPESNNRCIGWGVGFGYTIE